jgi:UDP-glucuronate 4-epimerase
MALFKFTDAILNDREIELYGEGNMLRDFTFIDDLVDAIAGLFRRPPDSDAASGEAIEPPFRIVNIGASRPASLEEFVARIETALGKTARRRLLPMQPGDVRRTWADVSALRDLVPDLESTKLADGVKAFVDWYCSYYRTTAPALAGS